MPQQNSTWNQFGGYRQIPGQSDQEGGYTGQRGGRMDMYAGMNGLPTGDRGSGSPGYGWGAQRRDQQQPFPGQQRQPQAPTPQAPQAPQASPNAATSQEGAAGQQAPAQDGDAGQQAPQTPSYAQYMPPQQPQMNASWVQGDQGAAGAWSNGYNPHWEYQATPAIQQVTQRQEYPGGTFGYAIHDHETPALFDHAKPMSPETPSPNPTPMAGFGRAAQSPSQDLGVLTNMQAEASNPYASVPVAALDPTGWKDGINPQMFQMLNPYYGQTGYYGDLAQVQAQMAGKAQSAGIPQGVLGASTYTQNPAGQPAWQPAATPQQLVSQDLANWEANRWG